MESSPMGADQAGHTELVIQSWSYRALAAPTTDDIFLVGVGENIAPGKGGSNG